MDNRNEKLLIWLGFTLLLVLLVGNWLWLKEQALIESDRMSLPYFVAAAYCDNDIESLQQAVQHIQILDERLEYAPGKYDYQSTQ